MSFQVKIQRIFFCGCFERLAIATSCSVFSDLEFSIFFIMAWHRSSPLLASGFRCRVPFPACLMSFVETDPDLCQVLLQNLVDLRSDDEDVARTIWSHIEHCTIIPLSSRGSCTTNSIYSEPPDIVTCEEVVGDCKFELIGLRFRQGWRNGRFFVSAQILHPKFGMHQRGCSVNNIGWINIWSGRSRREMGTLYCTVRVHSRTSPCCLCGRCKKSWFYDNWHCPLVESTFWDHQNWRMARGVNAVGFTSMP